MHNLLCNLTLPSIGEVWRAVSQQISTHIFSHHITTGWPSTSESFFSIPMFLIHPIRGRQAIVRKFIESDLTASTFTVSNLTKLSHLMSNPEENAELPLLFFGKSLNFSLFCWHVSKYHSTTTPSPLGASYGWGYPSSMLPLEGLEGSAKYFTNIQQSTGGMHRGLSQSSFRKKNLANFTLK